MSHVVLPDASPVFAVLVQEVAEDEARRPLTSMTHVRTLLRDAFAQFEYELAQEQRHGTRLDAACVRRQVLLRIATVAIHALRHFKLEMAADAIDQDIPY